MSSGSVTDMDTPVLSGKPRLRGSLHHWSFVLSMAAGATLVTAAATVVGSAIAVVSCAIYVAGVLGLFGISALYHRYPWRSDRARARMRRLDHSMIFVFIAASYTPVTLLALRPAWGITLLALAWTGALAGIVIKVLRLERWGRIGFALYLVLGWLAIVAAPQLVQSLSGVQMGLLLAGGLLYTVGAVILARRQPDPSPAVFGYHEVWHTFVVGASSCHFALVFLLVRA